MNAFTQPGGMMRIPGAKLAADRALGQAWPYPWGY